eukprot:88025-Amorphochlora_amoeboformis.AAC.2
MEASLTTSLNKSNRPVTVTKTLLSTGLTGSFDRSAHSIQGMGFEYDVSSDVEVRIQSKWGIRGLDDGGEYS